MNTKLVYVLTCAPEKTYIEQALMAVYSARYWNPDAYIVLITDNHTDALLTGRRGEILDYVSEKIVKQFPDTDNMMYRSRWLKTSVRNMVEGDFLFIDCDTICCQPLDDADRFKCEVGAVYDSHLPVSEYCDSLFDSAREKVGNLGIKLENESHYFSSGVIFAKDTEIASKLFCLWHNFWIEGTKKGTTIDQPALLKADIQLGHIIQRIPDTLNCVMYTEPDFAEDASILHFAAYRNPSWLFSSRVLNYLKENGLEDWLIQYILKPHRTYLPFRYSIYSSNICQLFQKILNISKGCPTYRQNVDSEMKDFIPKSRWTRFGKKCFKNGLYFIGAVICLFPSWAIFKLRISKQPKKNICAK